MVKKMECFIVVAADGGANGLYILDVLEMLEVLEKAQIQHVLSAGCHPRIIFCHHYVVLFGIFFCPWVSTHGCVLVTATQF